MIRIYGHAQNLRALEQNLPSVALFRGPPSVGKWTAAQYLAEYHGFLKADTRLIEQLNTEASRDLKQFASTGPFGKRKLATVRIDGATESALNALLKLLEEPPATMSFILVAVRPSLDTITSRSHVYRFGLLHRDDLFDVLTNRIGMAPSIADRAADLGRGQVDRALLSDQQDTARAAVLAVLKAVKDSDPQLLDAACAKWDDEAHNLLRHWCVEAITGRWQVFTEQETFGLTRDKTIPRRILIGLRSNARPKLAVRVGITPLLSRS